MLDDCIESEWPHSHRDGYAQAYIDGHKWMAHRWAYVQAHGLTREDIAGLVVRHTCDHPPCVNPDHLLIGTHKDNAMDRVERGRGRAWHAERTHCQAGHLLPEPNANNRRICKTCDARRQREYQTRKKEAYA